MTSLRNILAVASECAPMVKTGGLADVVGALPHALAPHDLKIRTLIPGYPAVMAQIGKAKPLFTRKDLLGHPARILAAKCHGLDLLILDAPALFARGGTPYLDESGKDWRDNDLRFAALSFTAAEIAAGAVKDWRPDVLHLHDWQAGLTPVYMQEMGATQPCVMTIHNMAFHGLTSRNRLKTLRLPASGFEIDGFEYYGHISALKAGLTMAQALTTVSPTYAQELMTPEFGMGLDGVIRARAGALTGILNGIDTTLWCPQSDPAIKPFSTPAGKARNTQALRAEFGLADSDGPLAVVVSRLSDQKGLDLLLQALPALIGRGGQLALLGSGDRQLEHAWLTAAAANPQHIGVRIGYDDALSRRMFAGADAVLVPSRFEPCGLTQLYGLRYGALPVVARTGGLADTVIHANAAALATKCATGITHKPDSVPALAAALSQLCTLYADQPLFQRLQGNAMTQPVGWEASAPLYAALFNRLATDAQEAP